ncbi:MAG: secondary thiamine-phosphate synthase enzyme YjbQ [Chloroflexota bacterium]
MYQLEIQTGKRQVFVDITAQVQQCVESSGVVNGYCHLFCPHTTAGITFNENWDPDVRHDMEIAFDAIAPQRAEFQHGEGNSPAHVKTSLVSSDHTIFVASGKLLLGRWQGVYLAEFDGARTRTVYVKVRAD